MHFEGPVFLFPGQGGYIPGVFAKHVRGQSISGKVLAEVRRVSKASLAVGGPDVWDLLTEPGAPGLDSLIADDPARMHMAIFATEMVAYALCTNEFGISPAVLAGHSFGEFAALTCSGAVDLESGAALVAARDSALLRVRPADGGMTVLRVGARRAELLSAVVDEWDLTVAVDNGPDQVVISGSDAGLARLAAVAAALGIQTTSLRVPYPFHNRILQGAAELFAEEIDKVRFHTPKLPVFSPVLGRYVHNAGDVREVFESHLVRPVKFFSAITALRSEGHQEFVECGARSTLVDLVRGIFAGVSTAAPWGRRADVEFLHSELAKISTGGGSRDVAAVGEPVTHDEPVTRGADKETAEVLASEVLAFAEAVIAIPARAEETGPGEPELLSDLRAMYAEAIGYPVEVFEPDIELEAELGIDSIRQTELLQRAREKYGVRDLPDLRITDYVTLEQVAGLIEGLKVEGSGVRA